MKTFLRIFGRGLFALLPTFLSVYIIIKFFHWADNTVSSLLMRVLPENFYIPGMGILFGILFIFLLGLGLSNFLGRKLHEVVDNLFRRVPLVKSVYTAIQDLTDYFSPKKDKGDGSQVVAVNWPNLPVTSVGLVTRADLDGLPEGLNKPDRVAVFIPMSYQIGGYTAFVPKAWLTPLDMSVEVAMRSALTAWMKKNDTV